MTGKRQAYLYAAVAVLTWSTVASAFKISLRYVSFIQLLFYASLVSTVILFVILLLQNKLSILGEYSKRDYVRSALLGFLNPFLYYIVLFKAYSLLPAQEAQPLNWTWPITLAVLSVPLLKERLRWTSMIALAISFIGVLIISTRGDILGFRFTNPGGVFLALGSSIVWALFWIYNVKDRRDAVAKLFLNFTFGSVYVVAATLLFSESAVPEMKGLVGAIYVGLFEMGITFVVWLKALSLSETTALVGNFIYVTPFLSLIVIRFVVGEEIVPSSIIGLVLIVMGIVVQQCSSRSRSTFRSDRNE